MTTHIAVSPTEVADRNGISVRALGTTGAVLAPMLAVEGGVRTVGHIGNTQHTPMTDLLGLLYLAGWAASSLGLRRLLTSKSSFYTPVFAVQMAGLSLAACQQLLEIFDCSPAAGTWKFMMTDLAWPLSHLYMLVVGGCVIAARGLAGWRRFAPMACGLALPLSMLLPALGGSRRAMEASFAVFTSLAFMFFGIAVRTTPRVA